MLHIFAPALIVSDILTFRIFDLQKVGQGNGEQLSQSCPLMANVEITKVVLAFFALALTVSAKRLELAQKVRHGHDVPFSQ